MHVWCVGVCLCVSEKGCTEVLSWEHPVSDPCLSSCVERTLQCVCMSVCVQKETVRQKNSTKNRGALCGSESLSLSAHPTSHVVQPEEKSTTTMTFELCTDTDSHRTRWPPRCICAAGPSSTHCVEPGRNHTDGVVYLLTFTTGTATQSHLSPWAFFVQILKNYIKSNIFKIQNNNVIYPMSVFYN